MKKIIIALTVLGSLVALGPSEADAFVCARGPFRAGCIGPRGAVGIRRGGFYGGGLYRGGAVYRGGYGRGVYRRY